MKQEEKDALLIFIKSVQKDGSLTDLGRTIRVPPELKPVYLNLSFGNGYFDRSKVLVRAGNELLGEVETEEAVAAFLEGRIPQAK